MNAPELNMFPLQIRDVTEFRLRMPSSDDVSKFLFVIAVVIIVLIILNLLKAKTKIAALTGQQSSTDTPRKFSALAFHRMASSLGLDREQTKMLEFILRSDNVSDPERSLHSPTLLDRHFERAYRVIERTSISEDELNDRLSVLFATRNIIDTNTSGASTASTRQIPEHAAAVMLIEDTSYPVQVISSRGDSLVVENPISSSGNPVRLSRGSKVSLSFFTKTSKGFSVETRVLGSTETADGPVLQLVHSGQIKKLSNRRFRRRQTVIATAFYLVSQEENSKPSKKKGSTKLVVDKRRFTGNIMDISIGGCSIKTAAPVNSGQKLKIEFTREDNSIVAALGEVLRTNRTGASTIIHVKFLKVPRRSLNSINAMVYEYSDS